ncbi:potassium-transporting ATPase subunit KdpB [Brevibacillus sp. HB1.2]|uniref:Potassium-transporting ATPase ATP-binding subunit n=1 Tax=Brevibacillus porteri TaxID=2126350 RepID=A0ABX5FR44_9BACL|nr:MULTISPECIES: potassium-transporting ATPase subunit KdpB [Brevibacillus]MDC0764532.1 potassium-transporting ATPase subunit KdpB [Brevibacillus sp. AG]MED1797014.1 potassium-transporting ATPase subunit KdpB [Brevibacillus porteri]MED2129767.1 potassium-transporting ATPase subunit KdpB [Brevibacillus porteri]MED2744717.1 potassium-transporting ATPase subunit KdpB [Brevibacillus porteri]MED2814510.1 potassium-transporting ATPase subunit KdpB [Brevibacillus porteri]
MKQLIGKALLDSFRKLNPLVMKSNPVLFVVELGTVLILLMLLFPKYFGTEDQVGWNTVVFSVLLFTVLFANFAEALAEGRGKAQADTLRRAKRDTEAKRLKADGSVQVISSGELRKGDHVLVETGDIIPGDGDIIDGLASIDESAITGESAPVIKRAGSDQTSVTGGTRVISDSIIVKITTNPGDSFLDRMIMLIEGAKRQKAPNEIALNTVLIVFTLIFLIVVVTLVPIASYVGIELDISVLVVLLVCLIPTTIGGLLSAIGIAGMDRVTRFGVIAMSGKAVEAAGDVNTIILDKTGTITYGNRLAAEFVPVAGVDQRELMEVAVLTSLFDDTPEGSSVMMLAQANQVVCDVKAYEGEIIPFTAEERMSGLNYKGVHYRKGAVSAISAYVRERGGMVPPDLEEKSARISLQGGTPLAVCKDSQVLGLIYLKDTVKPGIRERFEELRKMGIRTVMCTGDNPLTAATIAKEAGVDDFIAESKPEDKIRIVREEQAQGKMVAMTGDGTNDAPALAQADVGIAMNSGTTAAKEAANMVDLDSDPTKILQVISIGKQLLMTRGALTTFSIANDFSKYFAIIPAMLVEQVPEMQLLNIMNLQSPSSAVLSALLFNAIIIPLLIPLALRGVRYVPMNANQLLVRNLLIYGVGGIIFPFIGIKLIDMGLQLFW